MELHEVLNQNESSTIHEHVRETEKSTANSLRLMEQPDKQCPICLDSFQCPKLLPCMHTFCLGCIRTHMIKTKIRNQITCPLCRKTCRVMTANLDCILNNYFVEAADSVQSSSKSCALCNKCDDDVIECVNCEIEVCSECIVLHDRMCSRNEEMTSKEHAVERSSDIGDVSLPFHLLLSLPFIKTIILTNQISCFSVGTEGPESGYVNSIYPASNGQCWVVVGSGPEVTLFDVNGREVQTLDSGSRLSDALSTPDNSLFVAVFDSRNRNRNGILKISLGGDVNSFVKYNNCEPAEISLFPDGRLVVAWLYGSETENERTRGTIHIYSPEGRLLKDFGQTKDLSILSQPFAVAVNPVFGFINVSDIGNRNVLIFSEDGDLIGTYGADSSIRNPFGLFMGFQQRFIPDGLCCDRDGNIIVCDSVNHVLHLLSPKGEFIGIILYKREDGMGNPGAVAVDNNGWISVGDCRDGTVRVLEVNAYHNCFDRQEE